jgi:hypothetical protein
MVAWWESPKEEWRFEWLRLLFARVRATIGRAPSRRSDVGQAQRHAPGDR